MLNDKDFIGGREGDFGSEKRFYENFNNEIKIKSFVIYSVVQKTKKHMEKFKYTGRSYSLFER